MIINNVPEQCFLLLSEEDKPIALIKLEVGNNDITNKIELVIEEHNTLEKGAVIDLCEVKFSWLFYEDVAVELFYGGDKSYICIYSLKVLPIY